jgi:hypothetical protein
VMPSCLIELHHDEILAQALAHLSQEQRSHGGIGGGQDQAEEFAGLRSYGREDLDPPRAPVDWEPSGAPQEEPNRLEGARAARSGLASCAMIRTGRRSSAGRLATAASTWPAKFF